MTAGGRRPVAMVTGASRDIGQNTAFAPAGFAYDVAFAARTVVEGTGTGSARCLDHNAVYVGPENDKTFVDIALIELKRRLYADPTARLLLAQRAAQVIVAGGGGDHHQPHLRRSNDQTGRADRRRWLGAGLWLRQGGPARGGINTHGSAAETSAATTSSPVWWRPNGLEPHHSWAMWPSRGRCRPWWERRRGGCCANLMT